MPEDAPSEASIRAALDELLGWQGISRSPQLSELLRYVVEKTLAGDEASIKAYSIAVDVFGRPQTFDPQSDPIVRVQARRLRTLLDQFYESSESRSDVEIRLPLGRYVPEFRSAKPIQHEATSGKAGMGTSAQPVASMVRRGDPNRFWVTVLLGASFTIIGIAAVVFLLRWAFPPSSTVSGGVPDFPSITVGEFDNLTGQGVLDDDVAAVATRVREDLNRFELLRVMPSGGRYELRATVQQTGAQFSLKAMLSLDGSDGIVWSTVVTPPVGLSDTDALAAASTLLSAILGASTGPLHTADRAWLAQQPKPPAATLYVCALEYMAWRDQRKLDTAMTAQNCLKDVLARSPNDSTVLAADAGLAAWIKGYEAAPGVDQVPLLADEATEAGQAVSLSPTSSFAYQQQGLVLARQGLLDAAVGALKKSVELNPASMEALAVYALVQWGSGDYAGGVINGEKAIAGVPSPPPYFYITRAFDAMRQRRFYDAIDAAQALAAGDEELGPAIVVAAAPVIGRNDLIDRYRPMILSNPHFQAGGIMTRLMQYYRMPVLLDRIREGLVLAGIPPAALNGPFNADGTVKTTS